MADNDRSGWSGAERRKKKEERWQSNGLQSCFPTSPSLLFLLERKVPECGGKRVNGTWTEHRWLPQARCEVSTISYGLGGRCHQLVLVTSASSSLLLMQRFTKISWNISWCQLPINSLEITSSYTHLPAGSCSTALCKIHTSMVWELPRTCVRLACQLTSFESHQKFMGDCEKEVA